MLRLGLLQDGGYRDPQLLPRDHASHSASKERPSNTEANPPAVKQIPYALLLDWPSPECILSFSHAYKHLYLQYSFLADDIGDEETIWRSLLGVLERIDNPVLIHYGAYETRFLKRLARRYPDSAADSYVSTLITRGINLLGITYSQIYFPTYSNRLKEVARHLGFQWSHPAASGLQSLVWRQQWEETRDTSIKQVLITYNREDCEALEVVTRAVERVAVFAQGGCSVSGDATESAYTQKVYEQQHRTHQIYSLKRKAAMLGFQVIEAPTA